MSTKFTEAKLEQAIIELLGQESYPHVLGQDIAREPDDVLIKEDLKNFLAVQYKADNITPGEIESIIRKLETFPSSDLYDSDYVSAGQDTGQDEGSEKASENFGMISERIRKEFGSNVAKTFEIIYEHPSYSAEEVAAKLGKTSRTVENYLAKLKQGGVIVRKGPRLGGHWEVVE